VPWERQLSSSKRYAVIGDPIAHSLSPAMQSAAFADAGIDAMYQAVRVTPQQLPDWLQSDALSYDGFNVTIPHKEAVASTITAEAHAARLGAVNTVTRHVGSLMGWNTDYAGFEGCLRVLKLDVRGHEAVVFGAGGSARAVVRSLLDLGAAVTVINRTREKADSLLIAVAAAHLIPVGIRRQDREAESAHRRPGTARVLIPDEPAALGAIAHARLLVNTTPLGMSHLADRTPLPEGASLVHQPAVIDLVYGGTTPLVAAARTAGCPTLDGIEMLVQQGAASFHMWTGVSPDLDVMRCACLEELERR
jgi:shikimate dehydrogenase